MSRARTLRSSIRWADGQNDQLPAMAADLVRRQVAVIAAMVPQCCSSRKISHHDDPNRLPERFRPGRTWSRQEPQPARRQHHGHRRLATELVPKLLELLHEVAPNADNIAFLMNPASLNAEVKTREAQAAAHSLGLKQLVILTAGTSTEIDSAFAAMTERRANALLIGQDVFFNNQVEQLAALALRNNGAGNFSLREFAAAGGLMSYGASLADQYRLVGSLRRPHSQG